ncbi:MAG: hypothetical protein HN337_05365 [Deltaproteobacteria bacterium]|jgi:hypothetical protein|nr:hypothetical protein [Deltaproteobacteria bacterium]
MKKTIALFSVLLIAVPILSYAQDASQPEIEEETLDASVTDELKTDSGDTVIVKEKETAHVSDEVSYEDGAEVERVEVNIDKSIKIAPAFHKKYREGSFRAGLVGPGVYAGNKNINVMMGLGVEGEYFFFEQFSAGLRINLATDFKSDNNPNTIVSFVPQARYVFDLESAPRWSFYVQAGAGIALVDGGNIAADIAIPGGGFWWQYNDSMSFGFDASLHLLVRSNMMVSFFAGPAFRYQF